jgi:lipoprotein-anchoring transpeptidase ErfK/SrfK
MRLNLPAVALVAGAVLFTSPGIAAAAPVHAAHPVSATHPVTVRYVPAHRTLYFGDYGSDVRRLQRQLAALHYYPGAVSGTFDDGTLEAVWAFQEVQGLPVTGVVEHSTERALRHPKASRPLVPRGGATRVEVDLDRHVLQVYHHNRVVLISHVSSGGGYSYCSQGWCGYAITPVGNFHTTWRASGWERSPLGMLYNPVFFHGGFAIHGEPYVPVQPVSHGCVRIPMDVAQIFPRLVRTPGTPVYIRG